MTANKKPTLGVIILAHGKLDRVADLIEHWSKGGAALCVHIDAKCPAASLKQAFKDDKNVHWLKPRACRWGTWDLVQITLESAAQLLPRLDDNAHILLQSGDCLPFYPAAQFMSHLTQHTSTDFIETSPIRSQHWVQGGLSQERFTRYFFWPWQSKRRLFNWSLIAQRRLKIQRKPPQNIHLALGSQWWCLRAKTLGAILSDPRLPHWKQYFQRVWIPDESFFQSLAALFGHKIANPLTWARFDLYGKPYVLYDDHYEYLCQSPPWIARKIAPEAKAIWQLMGKAEGTPNGSIDQMIQPWDQKARRKVRAVSNLGSLPDRYSGLLRPHLVVIGDIPPNLDMPVIRPFAREPSKRQWLQYDMLDRWREIADHAPTHTPLILHIAPEDFHHCREIIESDPDATRIKTPYAPTSGIDPRKGAILKRRIENWKGVTFNSMDQAREFMALWYEAAKKDHDGE